MKNRKHDNDNHKGADDRVIVANDGTFDAEKSALYCCLGAATVRT